VPGVFRPYTLVDVLGTLNDQSTANIGSDAIVNGLGVFAETDETASMADSMATTVQLNSVYDAGVWGALTWG
jgi:hypothetical protein